MDPTFFFGYDGNIGPEFMGADSGVIQDTGHLGYLLVQDCKLLTSIKVDGSIRRVTMPHMVTVVDFSDGIRIAPELRPTLSRRGAIRLASIPILSSLSATALCGFYSDWYCFSTILPGIITNGVSCLTIGSGILTFTHPKPLPNSPKGGILLDGTEMVILVGGKGAVNSVTRGRFSLRFRSEPEYRTIGLCSLLMIGQLLAQVLLIPQGSLFGQIMFLVSLIVAWGYNAYLSSLDRDKIQRQVLNEVLQRPRKMRFQLRSRVTSVVFISLIVQPRDPRKFLDDLLPNSTVWDIWKRGVLRKLEMKKFDFEDSDFEGIADAERSLLGVLYQDAGHAACV